MQVRHYCFILEVEGHSCEDSKRFILSNWLRIGHQMVPWTIMIFILNLGLWKNAFTSTVDHYRLRTESDNAGCTTSWQTQRLILRKMTNNTSFPQLLISACCFSSDSTEFSPSLTLYAFSIVTLSQDHRTFMTQKLWS